MPEPEVPDKEWRVEHVDPKEIPLEPPESAEQGLHDDVDGDEGDDG